MTESAIIEHAHAPLDETAHYEDQYLALMAKIWAQGDERVDRTGIGTRSLFGETLRFSLADDAIPLLTTKRVYWKTATRELLWFLSGDTNIRPLIAQGVRIWSDWPHAKYVRETGDAVEFLEHIKVDLFPDQVYVFTPKGKIFNMPAGSCCVDFAYAVHSDIGDSCIAAKINHELVPLRTRLKNGDQVEIVSAVHARPNPSWLTFVTTGKARSHIRHFLKSLRFEESVLLGDRLLAQGFASLNQPLQQVSDDVWERYLKENGEKSRDARSRNRCSFGNNSTDSRTFRNVCGLAFFI